MNHVNHFVNGALNGVLNGAGLHADTIIFVSAVLSLLFFCCWLWRVATLTEVFLKNVQETLRATWQGKNRSFLIYKKEELKGSYKGREVIIGVIYAGFKGEFMPLPCVRMKLKEALGYNTNRLPNYAVIEDRHLVYNVKPSLAWGVFDKNYPQVFSKNALLVILEKLLAAAEDLERGRTAAAEGLFK